MLVESKNIEFKQQYTPDIKKTVVAFANSGGGVIYIGITDEGKTSPIENIDEVLLKVTGSIREGILPDITMFVNYETTDDKVIKVIVSEGANKPYYLVDKGLKPSGVYVRQGSSSSPASSECIRQMIKATDGDKFELMRALNGDLHFSYASEEFKNRNVEFSEIQMKTLGLKTQEGTYTNLGLLLSDECSHTVKAACFEGTDKGVFKDRREFGGSLLKQLRDTFDYINLFNRLHARFEGIDRIEGRDYPERAIREALLNAIVHREYSFSGSTLVNIYDDRIEFVSLGGLVPGLSYEDILLGISQTRNEKLAAVFYRLRLIEAYGMGLKQILNNYKNCERKPRIKVTDGAFLIELPNINYDIPQAKSTDRSRNIQHEKITEYIKQKGSISRSEVEKLLSVKQTRAIKIISELLQEGLISATGRGKGKRYC